MTLNKKLFFVIWLSGILSVLAVLPYVFELQKDVLESAPLSLPVLAFLSFIQSAALFAIATALGLSFARKVGFRFPVLESVLSGNGKNIIWKQVIYLPVALGIIAGLVISVGDWLFFLAGVSLDVDMTSIPLWKKFLGSFYGGIGEEILLRLFIVSMFVWILAKISKVQSPLSSNSIMWIAIILAAVLFGIGHLPGTAAITAITPLVVARAIALNGVGGLIFGWLYWKRGIVSAVIAHFCADIMLLIVIPSLLLL